MPTPEDAFDRAARREAEIAEELARGRITSEQAEQLRDLSAPGDGPGRSSGPAGLSFDQLRRVIDDDLDPDLLGRVIRLHLALSVDEIIDLVVDYDAGLGFFAALADPLLADVDYRAAAALLDNDVDPALVARARRAGVALSVTEAVGLIDHGAELEDVCGELERHPIEGLTSAHLCRLADNDVELRVLRRILEVGDGLSVDQAVDLACRQVDPDVFARLVDTGVEIDLDELGDTGGRGWWNGATIGVNLGDRRIGMHFGHLAITEDTTIWGVVIGAVTATSGVRLRLEARVTGDVIVERMAEVTIPGHVSGRVLNRGGTVHVTGKVAGGVVDEPLEAASG